MNNARILSYNMSKKLSNEELESISGAGMTCSPSGSGSWDPATGAKDGSIDITVDF